MVHNSQPTTHHGALDGGILGGLAGHHGNNGHTGRDAIIGAGAGHIAESHHEQHNHAVGTTAGVHSNTHHHVGLPVGTPGTKTTTTTTTVPKPSVGDKISGATDVLVGKLTNNPAKVQIGEIKKNEGKAALGGAAVGDHVRY